MELIHPSGHRQVCKPLTTGGRGEPIYSSETFTPEGDYVETKYFTSTQLGRMIRMVRRSGGEVRETEVPRPDSSNATKG